MSIDVICLPTYVLCAYVRTMYRRTYCVPTYVLCTYVLEETRNRLKRGGLESSCHQKNKMLKKGTAPENIAGHGLGLPRIAPFWPRIVFIGGKSIQPPLFRWPRIASDHACLCLASGLSHSLGTSELVNHEHARLKL